MSPFFVLVLAVIAVINAAVNAEDFMIESPKVTNWGNWGNYERCSNGSFVYGARLKVQKYGGIFDDDTALNAIELFCIKPSVRKPFGNQALETISSTQGHKGEFMGIAECPYPGYMTGFQLRSEKNQLAADDTAANNLRVICSGGQILDAEGLTFGDWTSERHCPRNHYVCGIRTQVESCCNTDDTSLNNVAMGCCPYTTD